MNKEKVKLPIRSEYNNCDTYEDLEQSVKAIVDSNQRQRNEWLKQQYEKMDIKLLDSDDLCYNAILPDDWYIKKFKDSETEYAVYDNNNKIRVLMEFQPNKMDIKSCYSYIATRYNFNLIPVADEKKNKYYGIIYDSDKAIYKTKIRENKDIFDQPALGDCQKYLDEHFPEWQDVNAYWDK